MKLNKFYTLISIAAIFILMFSAINAFELSALSSSVKSSDVVALGNSTAALSGSSRNLLETEDSFVDETSKSSTKFADNNKKLIITHKKDSQKSKNKTPISDIFDKKDINKKETNFAKEALKDLLVSEFRKKDFEFKEFSKFDAQIIPYSELNVIDTNLDENLLKPYQTPDIVLSERDLQGYLMYPTRETTGMSVSDYKKQLKENAVSNHEKMLRQNRNRDFRRANNTPVSASRNTETGRTTTNTNNNNNNNNNTINTRDVAYSTVPNMTGTAPVTGTYNIPVLLVTFSDNNSIELDSATINEMFNGSNYLNGDGISVSEYYYRNSYGALDVTFDIYDWTVMPNTYAYYADESTGGVAFNVLAHQALSTFDPVVDYSQYDSDGNGRIDGVYVVSSAAIPSITWVLGGMNHIYYDGKLISNVAMVYEIDPGATNAWQYYYNHPTDNRVSIVRLAHEFAHLLGSPETYANAPNGGQVGYSLGKLSMMTTLRVPNFPMHMTPWLKFFFGWIQPEIITHESDKYIDIGSYQHTGDTYILQNSLLDSREFFLVDNRYVNSALGLDENNLDMAVVESMTSSGQTTQPIHDNLGITIYHIDEQYIEDNLLSNSIMYDEDGIAWADVPENMYHPGITVMNNLFSIYDVQHEEYDSDVFYSTEVRDYFPQQPFNIFDANYHLDPSLDVLLPGHFIHDTTSKSYNGTLDTKISLEALSPGSPVMTAKVLVAEETEDVVSNYTSGNYNNAMNIILTTPTNGAVIYYTTDGSEPSVNSTVYTNPIQLNVGDNVTIKTIAKKQDWHYSDVVTYNYNIQGTVADVQPSVPSGSTVPYESTVALSTTTPGADIYYTLDGSYPNQNDALYTGPITINGEYTTIKSRAFKTGWNPSNISTFVYYVDVVDDVIATPGSGQVDYNTLVTLTTNTQNAVIYYTISQGSTTNNTEDPVSPANGIQYTGPIPIVEDSIIRARAFKTDYKPSDETTYTYTVYMGSPDNYITSFTLANQNSQRTTINNDTNVIRVTMPSAYPYPNVGVRTPIIEVSNGATVNPGSLVSVDFDNDPITYTVTAQDGSTRDYAVDLRYVHYTTWAVEETENYTTPHNI